MSRFQMNVERLALAGFLSFAYCLGPAAFAASTADDGWNGATRGSRATHGMGEPGSDQTNLGQRAPVTMPSETAPIEPSWYFGPDGLLPNRLLPNPPTYG